MLNKIQVLSSSLPKNINEGFILDTKANKIVSTSKNYTIPLPFKIVKSSFYNFELSINNSTINLNFIIDIDFFLTNFYNEIYIREKNCIFNLLRIGFKNKKKEYTIENFNKFIDITELINKSCNKILKNNIVNLNNNYFNIMEESICNNNLIFLNSNIYFLYGDIYNLQVPKNYKLCIVDDINNFDNDNFIITKDNYNKITYDEYTDNNIFFLPKDLFQSNQYMYNYRIYHSSYKSEAAYNNYKQHLKEKHNFPRNIELYDNIIFVIKNVQKKIIKNHPIIYSDSPIIIISKYLDKAQIDSSYAILFNKFKNSNVNINNLVSNRSFIDNGKYILYNIYKNINNVIFKLYTKDEKIKFISDNEYLSYECPITKEEIGYDPYIKLDCNHIFNYSSLYNYFESTMKCPYCQGPIKNSKIRLSLKNFIDILNIKKKNIYFLFKSRNQFTSYLDSLDVHLIKIDEYNIPIELEDDSCFILDNQINIYDFVNIKINNSKLLYNTQFLILNYHY